MNDDALARALARLPDEFARTFGDELRRLRIVVDPDDREGES